MVLSFNGAGALPDEMAARFPPELHVTPSHELTHHMEACSGLHALDDRDGEELEPWRREYRPETYSKICGIIPPELPAGSFFPDFEFTKS